MFVLERLNSAIRTIDFEEQSESKSDGKGAGSTSGNAGIASLLTAAEKLEPTEEVEALIDRARVVVRLRDFLEIAGEDDSEENWDSVRYVLDELHQKYTDIPLAKTARRLLLAFSFIRSRTPSNDEGGEDEEEGGRGSRGSRGYDSGEYLDVFGEERNSEAAITRGEELEEMRTSESALVAIRNLRSPQSRRSILKKTTRLLHHSRDNSTESLDNMASLPPTMPFRSGGGGADSGSSSSHTRLRSSSERVCSIAPRPHHGFHHAEGKVGAVRMRAISQDSGSKKTVRFDPEIVRREEDRETKLAELNAFTSTVQRNLSISPKDRLRQLRSQIVTNSWSHRRSASTGSTLDKNNTENKGKTKEAKAPKSARDMAIRKLCFLNPHFATESSRPPSTVRTTASTAAASAKFLAPSPSGYAAAIRSAAAAAAADGRSSDGGEDQDNDHIDDDGDGGSRDDDNSNGHDDKSRDAGGVFKALPGNKIPLDDDAGDDSKDTAVTGMKAEEKDPGEESVVNPLLLGSDNQSGIQADDGLHAMSKTFAEEANPTDGEHEKGGAAMAAAHEIVDGSDGEGDVASKLAENKELRAEVARLRSALLRVGERRAMSTITALLGVSAYIYVMYVLLP
eukprot:jgi/Bigna1/75218/fgenesh1_pg.33_\